MRNKLIGLRCSEKVIENLCITVFFGSLWGIVEATLGYLLHKVNLSVGWCLWFPLAFYFMEKIYRKTEKANYMLYGAIIAAVIKLTNIFIEVRIDKVINPSVSIILEGASLMILYKVIENKNKKLNLLSIAGVNIGWRVLYSSYILVMPAAFLVISPLRGINPFLKFMLLESLVNTLIITFYVVISGKMSKIQKEKANSISKKLVPSICMFLFAIILQWII